ncbi:MAG: hypothetical protein LBN74_02040 [Prevotella sp.]|jgi:hypothetical protein|nr:hypothetical protein [Prevotella sp.]
METRMKTEDVLQKIENEFAEKYTHFKDFQFGSTSRAYWDKCMESVADDELFGHIIFCNDVFSIPPVKTFLTFYLEDFIQITGDERATLDISIKRGIGAFWGMVFKFCLKYSEQKSVSVSMNEYFKVKTATFYSGKPDDMKRGSIQ